MLLAVVVHSASLPDCHGAKLVCMKLLGMKLLGRFPRLKLIWADGAYSGKLIDWVAAFAPWVLQIVEKPEGQKGFVVLSRRWVVERTFACASVGGGAHLCLAVQVPSALQGL